MTYLADRRWPCVKLSSLLALLCIVCTPGSCTQEKSSRTVGRIQNLNSSVGEDTFDSSGTARSGVLDIAARPLVSIVDTKVPEPLDKSARLRGRALSSVQDPRVEQSAPEEELGSLDAQSTPSRRRAGQELSFINDESLLAMNGLVLLQDEGIIYCPIPKVASAEWKRALRWMVGIEDWQGERSNLHSLNKNGLARLTDKSAEWMKEALESDRFFRFVVVREPAERLLSGFLNKCVTDGYMSGRMTRRGAPSCAYLDLMPELFSNVTQASPESHQRLRDLVERDPEKTFYHFVSGVWEKARSLSAPCAILSAFYVIPFSNMSAEAATLADRIPQAPPRDEEWEGTAVGIRTENRQGRGVPVLQREARKQDARTGIDDGRRDEIRSFLTHRFEVPQDAIVKVTRAAEHKNRFLSDRVMSIMRKLYKQDYELLGGYF